MLTRILLVTVLAIGESQTLRSSSVTQQTEGWCSPAIANVSGNVIVKCIGVDPLAMKRLNEELARKKLQTSDLVSQANDWARRYKELEVRLQQTSNDQVESRRAENYLHHGDLERAGAILDRLLTAEEKSLDRTAANHFNRGLVFELEFRPLDALPHLEKAYEYRPDHLKYAQEYATILFGQHEFDRAKPILLEILTAAHKGAIANPGEYLPVIARTLNTLANIYTNVGQSKEAEDAYEESIRIYRDLSQTSIEFQPFLALTLANRAMLNMQEGKYDFSLAAFQESISILGRLVKTDSIRFEPFLSSLLTSEGVLYTTMGRLNDAEASFKQSLDLQDHFAETNREIYAPERASTLDALALLYSSPRVMRYADAEDDFDEALRIDRELAKKNPERGDPLTAIVLTGLGDLYSKESPARMAEADAAYTEAEKTFTTFGKTEPEAARPLLNATLQHFAEFCFRTGRHNKALIEINRAIEFDRELWKLNPRIAADDLAQSLIIAVAITETKTDRCQDASEAAQVSIRQSQKDAANRLVQQFCLVP